MQFSEPPLATNISVANGTKETPHRLFWFKKWNGEFFCTKEAEAWNIMCGRVKVFENGRSVEKRHEYIGCSNSNTYFSGLKEVQTIFKTQGIEKAQEFLRDLERRELETADKTKRPRNFDRTNAEGVPVNAEGLPILF